jgi:hypothetical protein
VNVKLDRDVYLPGQNVTATISLPLSSGNLFNSSTFSNYNVTYNYEVYFDNLRSVRGRGPIVSANASVNVVFNIPRDTAVRQTIVRFEIEAQ